MRYACVSATDQAKAVRELTQNVRESTSDVSEQDVGETTVNRFRLLLFLLGYPAGVPGEERMLWYNYCNLSLFKFCFQLFQTHYHKLPYTEKQRKIKH